MSRVPDPHKRKVPSKGWNNTSSKRGTSIYLEESFFNELRNLAISEQRSMVGMLTILIQRGYKNYKGRL